MKNGITAIEFFSGIGAFSEAARLLNKQIDTVAAFDQNLEANEVYKQNFALAPITKNLESIAADDIPPARLWWLSPPCTPFSTRGKQQDLNDTRAAAFKNLLKILPHHRPEYVLMENVCGFNQSQAETLFISTLTSCRYRYWKLALCPSQFGIPNRRPRLFYIAAPEKLSDGASLITAPEPVLSVGVIDEPIRLRFSLSSILEDSPSPESILAPALQNRYARSLHIIDPADPDAVAICFTSGYGRSMKAAGSYIRLDDGRIRHFTAREILKLLGFTSAYQMPPQISLRTSWRLCGNSVSITCLEYVLQKLFTLHSSQ